MKKHDPRQSRRKHNEKEAAIVRDADGNELYFAETQGECESWCTVNNITGENGEYIAIGTFDEESRYFEAEDYAEINDWNKEVSQ